MRKHSSGAPATQGNALDVRWRSEEGIRDFIAAIPDTSDMEISRNTLERKR
jgi:hypothetical protein